MQNDASNKATLTPAECAELYDIGLARLRRYLKRNPDCGFIRKYYNDRILIDRERFDRFLSEGGEIRNAKKRRKDQKGQQASDPSAR